jgi:hypothetical protein
MLRKLPVELPGGASARFVTGATSMLPSFTSTVAPGFVRGSCVKPGGAGEDEGKADDDKKLLAELTLGRRSADDVLELTMDVIELEERLLPCEYDEKATVGDAELADKSSVGKRDSDEDEAEDTGERLAAKEVVADRDIDETVALKPELEEPAATEDEALALLLP